MPDSSTPALPFVASHPLGDRARQPGQVLVVEDNPVTLASVARTIENAGITVMCATTGTEAFEKAAIFRPDVVLLDINLPDMSGREVCRRLKQDPTLDHVLVVHLSAECTSATERVLGLDTGADAFLTHPITPGELIAQVRSMLRLKRAEQALRESRDLYRVLVEDAPVGIAHLTLAGAIASTNRHFAAMLGAAAATVAGRDLAGFILASERDEFLAAIERMKREASGRWTRSLRM